MTNPELLVLIGVVTTSIVTIMKQAQLGRKVEQASEAVAQTHSKIDDQAKVLVAQDKVMAGIEHTSKAVETQTNGNLAAVQAQLETSRREVAELKAAAAAKAEAAAELAAERARHEAAMLAERRRLHPTRRREKRVPKARR